MPVDLQVKGEAILASPSFSWTFSLASRMSWSRQSSKSKNRGDFWNSLWTEAGDECDAAPARADCFEAKCDRMGILRPPTVR